MATEKVYWLTFQPDRKPYLITLWAFQAPREQFADLKACGFNVCYGREGEAPKPSNCHPKGWDPNS